MLVAAERHWPKAGDWPATIDAIGPEILPNPPVDPFSGRPFRIARRGGRFVVYSIGPDQKDEQGAYDRKKWQNGGPYDVGAGGCDVSRRRLRPRPECEPRPASPSSPRSSP